MEIKNILYKDREALCLDSGSVQAVFIPDQGAKLCSLKDIKTGKEYMYQRKGEKYRMAKYADNYLEGECSGFDDTFPNIDTFYYDAYPWKGVELPDHGELWAIPWSWRKEESGILFETYGIRLPYHFQKKVSFRDEYTISIQYRLKNLSAFSIKYVWAAHMMLHAENGARFHMPEELHRAFTTISTSGTIGTYGTIFDFPWVNVSDNKQYDMRIHRENADDYQKIYFLDKVPGPEGWAAVRYPAGDEIIITYPTKEVPYLGIVQGEGGELNLRCMFLEPCTGLFDRPDLAFQRNAGSELSGNEEKNWYLNITINHTGGA